MIAPPPPLRPLADEAIELRGFAASDADALVEKLKDPEIARWTSVPQPYLRGHALDFLARGAETFGERPFSIRDTGEDRLLGMIGVRLADDRAYAELGYWVGAEDRGRGVVTRAIELCTTWALQDLGLGEVRIYVLPGNAASLRAAEKAGFTRDPELHRRPSRGGEDDYVLLTRTR